MPTVDHALLRVNQSFIITLLLLAFVLNTPWLVLLVALVLVYGSMRRHAGFKIFYTAWLKPRGWVKPEVLPDNPAPHLFSQGLGAAFVSASWLTLLAGATGVGWALAWLVVALASLNLFLGLCVGCTFYYWLNRLRVPGFTQAAPAGVFPGFRPRPSVE